MEAVFWELLQAIGRFFLHPAVYLFLFVCIWFGMRRVRRERKDFHTRVYDVVSDLLFPAGAALTAGAVLTIILTGLGVTVPFAMMLLITLIWAVLLPLRNSRWLSFSFAGSLALLVTMFLPTSGTGYGWIDRQLTSISEMSTVSFVWFLAAILFAEAFLIMTNGKKRSSPKLKKSKRGKVVGAHEVNRLWLVPGLLLIPAGGLAVGGLGMWPLAESVSGVTPETAGLMFVPVILGFKAVVQSGYPYEGFRRLGARMLGLALLTAAVAVAAAFYSPLLLAVPLLILLGRELIFIQHNLKEQKTASMFRNMTEGLVVLGVIPHSIGDKMGIKVGEKVMKANGLAVSSQIELYEALQAKAAFCKLQVLDEEGQIRFTQSSVYEGDHYQLGLLFVPDDDIGNLSTEGLRYTFILQKDREKIQREDAVDASYESEAAATEENKKSS
ncbi:PDZ domain-containing protein [Alteribacter keqinensis]|uniref:PDZ domain-containing protein n=1 Tax=Alteribacter keqinensis TaxID=2483800 RepID=A0A3M7TQT5_9BACI|nr:PDZ domain-containing protein [Alteribacter keqinensis]RNA67529.1 PDZ domain-containing protein [Alteribacter keqinensis]